MTTETQPLSNVIPLTAAKAIMDDPAAAAGAVPPAIVSPQISDPGVAKLLNDLPGLVGAIDAAIKDTVGRPLGFMLLVFPDTEGGTSLHATNADFARAQACTEAVVRGWSQEGAGENRPIAAQPDAGG